MFSGRLFPWLNVVFLIACFMPFWRPCLGAETEELSEAICDFSTAAPPVDLELQATVLYSSVQEGINPTLTKIRAMADRTFASRVSWSNEVSGIVRSALVVDRAEPGLKQVWHLRVQRAEKRLRYDTLEDILGSLPEPMPTFDDAATSYLQIGDPGDADYCLFMIYRTTRGMRISSDSRSLVIIPLERLLQLPSTIGIVLDLACSRGPSLDPDKAMAWFKRRVAAGFRVSIDPVVTVRDFGGGIKSVELRLRPVDQYKFPFLRGFYDSGSDQWLAFFLFSQQDGTVTSAAMGADGLGLPLRSQLVNLEPLGQQEPVVTVMDVHRYETNEVPASTFEPLVPEDWTVIDERNMTVKYQGKMVENPVFQSYQDGSDPDPRKPTKFPTIEGMRIGLFWFCGVTGCMLLFLLLRSRP